MNEFTPQQLERWAEIIADWADRMPMRNVYVFDKPRLHEGTHCLGLAFEFDGSVSDEVSDRWRVENETDFAGLKARLDVPIALLLSPTMTRGR